MIAYFVVEFQGLESNMVEFFVFQNSYGFKKPIKTNHNKIMSIKFKIIARSEPGVVGGGTKKFYASAKMTETVGIDQLTTSIKKISTLSEADVRAVLYALLDVTKDELAKSNIVKLGDIGSLKVSVSSNGYEAADEVTASAIKGSKVLFYPGKKLREMQKTLTYEKS